MLAKHIRAEIQKVAAAVSMKRPIIVRGYSSGNEILPSESDPVIPTEITKFLDSHGIPYNTGYACITTTCPKYTRKSLKLTKVDQLYINSTTGYFVCRSCKKSGPWSKLQDNLTVLMHTNPEIIDKMKCFATLEPEQSTAGDAATVADVLKSTENINLELQDHRELAESLGWDILTQQTLYSFHVKVLPDARGVVLPSYSADGECQWVKEIIVGSNNRLRTCTVPRLNYIGLFGWHLTKDKKVVVLTSSEADAMAVYQKTGTVAVSLPKGHTHLPQEALPFLESFTKIIVWFDNDMLAFSNAKLFARKLGLKRTLLVRPEQNHLSPLKALKAGSNLKEIMNSSSSIQHTNIISFSTHREDVKNELTFAKEVAGVRWKGYPRLNEILKGHRSGELTVFTGGTGTGKTTFISDYSLDLCVNGVNTLWGSFEINNIRLIKMMLQQFSKKNLSKHMDEFDYYADQFEQLPMYFMNFHGQESIKKVIETMSHAVYVYDIRHVIVDNLQFMMGTPEATVDRFHKQDIIVGSFRKFATAMNCHVTLVVHPRKESTEELTTNSIFGGVKASQEADNIMILQKVGLGSHSRKYIQITKNRFDGQLGSIGLKFDKESLSFSMKPSRNLAATSNDSEEPVTNASSSLNSLNTIDDTDNDDPKW